MPKILIIEDDPDIAAIERDYLELSGYEAVICADGTAGLNAALTESYDLLLLDLMLGSAYAIVNGPASLSTPLPPMNLTSFRWQMCIRDRCTTPSPGRPGPAAMCARPR